MKLEALKDGEEVRESLAERVTGRVAQEDVYHPITEELL